MIPNKTLSQFVTDLVTNWQQQLGITAALPSGDPLLALMQSVATQLVFLQSAVQLIDNLTRAQTSSGADLDSWMAQFSFTRLPAVFAQGPLSVSTLSLSTTPRSLPAGAIVQTPGGAIQYQAVADTTQAAWNASQNAYVLAAGSASMSVTARALVAGSSYNVLANQLTQFANPIPGLDSVSNAAAVNNGVAAESDGAFLSRFILYLGSLAKATQNAILNAIASVQQGLFTNLLENQNPPGTSQLGTFTAIIDDGSGAPSSNLLTAVYNAVFSVRAFGVQPFVSGPTKVVPVIVLNVRVPAVGYSPATVTAAVQAAVVAMINALAPGATVYISSIESAALAVAGVVSVQPGVTTINGSAADYVPAANAVTRVATSNVTVGTY